MDTHNILVTYPVTESEAARKQREKLGQPMPHYSFTVSGNANGIAAEDAKRMEERK
jgi:hypothetical protein